MESRYETINHSIKSNRSELLEVSRYIYDNPEVGFEERKASRRLVEVLKKHGFTVTYPAGGVETAFQATIRGQAERPHVAIMAEYDALPGLGHGCGHNLIATAALGAGLAVTQVISSLKGRLSVMGTPAEETLTDSGKMRLIAAGLFNDVDGALIVHPHGNTWLGKPFLAVDEVSVRFSGKSSHAASSPHLGINAYDAMQLTFTGISFLRQQLRQDARVHWGDLEVRGAKNVIPDACSATICVRALDDLYTTEVVNKVVNCVKGAALMTGCTPDHRISQGFRAMKYNRPMEACFGQHLGRLGVAIDELPQQGRAGSTDMGNVSKVVPSIHPFYKIMDGVAPHTPEFLEASKTEGAFEATLTAAAAMAMTVVDLLSNPGLMEQVKKDFSGR